AERLLLYADDRVVRARKPNRAAGHRILAGKELLSCLIREYADSLVSADVVLCETAPLRERRLVEADPGAVGVHHQRLLRVANFGGRDDLYHWIDGTSVGNARRYPASVLVADGGELRAGLIFLR